MSGKIALVTAATRGLGLEISKTLKKQGFQLALMGRSERIYEVADELGCFGFRGDLTNEEDIKSFVKSSVDYYGRIDVLINNTGHAPTGELLNLTDNQWMEGFEILFLNVVRLTREAVPHMTNGGVVVNVSSYAAKEPSAKFSVSSVIRAGLSAYTKLFANQYGPKGIRMVNLLPGYFETYEIDEGTSKSIPLRRPGTLDEIAKTAVFLVSNDAGYITGTDIIIDGGILKSN